jgi:hypothetical protein
MACNVTMLGLLSGVLEVEGEEDELAVALAMSSSPDISRPVRDHRAK